MTTKDSPGGCVRALDRGADVDPDVGPAVRHVHLEPGEAVFPFQSFTWRVTDVANDSMVMHVDFANLYWPGHKAGEQINENLGGISGPVYRVIEGQVDRLELVGFVFEYYSPWETMRARHAHRVNANGTIAR
jgi:hypothetical protein